MKTVLAVDIGSSSVKAGLVSVDGTVLSSVRIRFDKKQPFPWFWLSAMKTAFSSLLGSSAFDVSSLESLVISGAGPTLVAVSGSGEVSASLLWDEPVPAELNGLPDLRGDGAASSIFLPRLNVFRRMFPAETKAAGCIFSGPEFAVACLSGNRVTVLPEPRYTSAYWSPGLLEENGFPEDVFPPFVPPGFTAGYFLKGENPFLYNPYGDFFRDVLPEGTRILAGPPDFVSALLGTGTVSPGRACDRAGTSEGLNVCISEPVSAEGLRTLPSPVSGLWNISCLLGETGLDFRNFRDSSPEYAGRTYADLLAEVCESPIIPVPGMPVNPVREAAERIGFKVKAGIEKLKAACGLNPEFTLSGGQAKNTLWNQMKADITGSVFLLTQTADAELLGDAVIAFCASGDYSSYSEACSSMVEIKQRFIPDRNRNRIYGRKIRGF